MSEQTYEYVLKSDKLVSYSRISVIFFVINVASLLVAGFFAINFNTTDQFYGLVGAGCTLLWVIIVLLRGEQYNSRLRFTPGYAFVLFLWLKLGFYWVAAIVLLLAVLDYIARRPLLVRFTGQQIDYPSFPPRAIAWAELQNVVLKDGLLTIDFANNKMLQSELEEELLDEEAAEFNAFARLRLTESR